jgi:HPt (histidine-containing phosphotransfer) domain-containing protein
MAIDRAAFAQIRSLDQETGGGLLVELLELFYDGTPKRLSKIREAIAAGNPGIVEREAHSLKGSCGALGAIDLMNLAGELEVRARVGSLEGAVEKVDAIEAEFRSASALFDAEREKPLK